MEGNPNFLGLEDDPRYAEMLKAKRLQAPAMQQHTKVEKEKGLIEQAGDVAQDEFKNEASEFGKEQLSKAYNKASEYMKPKPTEPMQLAQNKAPISDASMQGMAGPDADVLSKYQGQINAAKSVNPAHMGMDGAQLGASPLGTAMGGQAATNAAMAANPATMGAAGAELGALASTTGATTAATGAAGAAGAGAGMAALGTAVPYIGAGIMAAKLLGVKGFSQGGEVGPLSPHYAADGMSVDDPNSPYNRSMNNENNKVGSALEAIEILKAQRREAMPTPRPEAMPETPTPRPGNPGTGNEVDPLAMLIARMENRKKQNGIMSESEVTSLLNNR